MGKTKNKRYKGKKPCPTGLPSVKEIEQEEEILGDDGGTLDVSTEQVIQSVIEKLQGVNVEEKECACCNVTTLIENPEALSEVRRCDVIKMIAPLLMDPSHVVRHAAAGALRNLSVIGGPEVCDVMVEDDVMTPLVALLKQYQEGCTITRHKSEKVDTKLGILEEAINLLWNLCECNNTALEIFNREKLITIVCHFMYQDIYGYDLAVAAAHCLHAVSEDNAEAIDELNQPVIMEQIESILHQQDTDVNSILLRLLTAGIYMNTINGNLTNCPPRTIPVIMDIISEALNLNCSSYVDSLLEKIFNFKTQRKNAENESVEKEDKEKAEVNAVIVSILAAQSIALEILTNICCNDDSADDWEDMDSSDASDEGLNGNNSMDCDVYNHDEKFPMVISSEIHEAIVSHNFVAKVIEKIVFVNEDIVKNLNADASMGKPILKRLTTLHCRALLCLHNLVSCLDLEDLGGPSHLYNVWINLAQLTFKHTYVCPKNDDNSIYCNSAEHIQFLEAVTSAIRALLQKLIQVKSFHLQNLTLSDIHMLCELAEKCTETSIRNNIVNTMGAVGNSLSKSESPNRIPIIKNIGIFLLNMCGKDTQVIVMAEALDAIFDVFGEDNTDLIAQEISLLERLKHILPLLRSKMNSQKKTLAHHYPIVMTVRTNLARFIKYKSEHQQTNGHH